MHLVRLPGDTIRSTPPARVTSNRGLRACSACTPARAPTHTRRSRASSYNRSECACIKRHSCSRSRRKQFVVEVIRCSEQRAITCRCEQRPQLDQCSAARCVAYLCRQLQRWRHFALKQCARPRPAQRPGPSCVVKRSRDIRKIVASIEGQVVVRLSRAGEFTLCDCSPGIVYFTNADNCRYDSPCLLPSPTPRLNFRARMAAVTHERVRRPHKRCSSHRAEICFIHAYHDGPTAIPICTLRPPDAVEQC